MGDNGKTWLFLIVNILATYHVEALPTVAGPVDPSPGVTCPVLECEEPCEYGYAIDDESHCAQSCDCQEHPCTLVKCDSGWMCVVFFQDCTFPGSCISLIPPEGRCVAKCSGGQVFDQCGGNANCDQRCGMLVPPCAFIEPCVVPRCKCPAQKPIFLNGRCIARTECPNDNQGNCLVTQEFNSCCAPVRCTETCRKTFPILCPTQCSARCCCPRNKPVMAADGVTCISRDQCPITPL